VNTDDCLICGANATVARKTKKGYDLVSCRECGLSWVSPMPTSEVLADYYSKNYRLAANHEQAELVKAGRDIGLIEGWIKQHAPQARTVCEIGCATGNLLHELSLRGYHVSGFELSSVTSEIARRSFGLDVTTGTFRADGPQFDVILIRHVLEHTVDPVDQINAIAKRLASGGLLIIAVPNGKGIGFRMLGEYWTWYVPPAHLWYFSSRNLQNLCARAGLKQTVTMTRQGDANDPILEVGLGIARWARSLIVGSNNGSLVPQTPEELPTNGALRRGVATVTKVVAMPLSLILNPAGGGDELWLVVKKEIAKS
jgi:2-polyprenyl-3-methyl-5-hydroxy-6-metoxy-1,4-benzoquinol methylase